MDVEMRTENLVGEMELCHQKTTPLIAENNFLELTIKEELRDDFSSAEEGTKISQIPNENIWNIATVKEELIEQEFSDEVSTNSSQLNILLKNEPFEVQVKDEPADDFPLEDSSEAMMIEKIKEETHSDIDNQESMNNVLDMELLTLKNTMFTQESNDMGHEILPSPINIRNKKRKRNLGSSIANKNIPPVCDNFPPGKKLCKTCGFANNEERNICRLCGSNVHQAPVVRKKKIIKVPQNIKNIKTNTEVIPTSEEALQDMKSDKKAQNVKSKISTLNSIKEYKTENIENKQISILDFCGLGSINNTKVCTVCGFMVTLWNPQTKCPNCDVYLKLNTQSKLTGLQILKNNKTTSSDYKTSNKLPSKGNVATLPVTEIDEGYTLDIKKPNEEDSKKCRSCGTEISIFSGHECQNCGAKNLPLTSEINHQHIKTSQIPYQIVSKNVSSFKSLSKNDEYLHNMDGYTKKCSTCGFLRSALRKECSGCLSQSKKVKNIPLNLRICRKCGNLGIVNKNETCTKCSSNNLITVVQKSNTLPQKTTSFVTLPKIASVFSVAKQHRSPIQNCSQQINLNKTLHMSPKKATIPKSIVFKESNVFYGKINPTNNIASEIPKRFFFVSKKFLDSAETVGNHFKQSTKNHSPVQDSQEKMSSLIKNIANIKRSKRTLEVENTRENKLQKIDLIPVSENVQKVEDNSTKNTTQIGIKNIDRNPTKQKIEENVKKNTKVENTQKRNNIFGSVKRITETENTRNILKSDKLSINPGENYQSRVEKNIDQNPTKQKIEENVKKNTKVENTQKRNNIFGSVKRITETENTRNILKSDSLSINPGENYQSRIGKNIDQNPTKQKIEENVKKNTKVENTQKRNNIFGSVKRITETENTGNILKSDSLSINPSENYQNRVGSIVKSNVVKSVGYIIKNYAKNECYYCNFIATNKKELVSHILNRCIRFHKSELIRCTVCDDAALYESKKCVNCASKCKMGGCIFTTWFKKVMLLHVTQNDHTFKCNLCNIKTKDRMEYKQHVRHDKYDKSSAKKKILNREFIQKSNIRKLRKQVLPSDAKKNTERVYTTKESTTGLGVKSERTKNSKPVLEEGTFKNIEYDIDFSFSEESNEAELCCDESVKNKDILLPTSTEKSNEAEHINDIEYIFAGDSDEYSKDESEGDTCDTIIKEKIKNSPLTFETSENSEYLSSGKSLTKIAKPIVKEINPKKCIKCGKSSVIRNGFVRKCNGCGYIDRDRMLNYLKNKLTEEVQIFKKKNRSDRINVLTREISEHIDETINYVLKTGITNNTEDLFESDLYEIFESLDVSNEKREKLKLKTCKKCGFYSSGPQVKLCHLCGYNHLDRFASEDTRSLIFCFCCSFNSKSKESWIKHVLNECSKVNKSELIDCLQCGYENIAGIAEKKCENCPRKCNEEGCNYSTWFLPCLQSHKKLGMHQYSCEKCTFKTSRQKYFKEHKSIEELRCPKCTFQGKNKLKLYRHMSNCWFLNHEV